MKYPYLTDLEYFVRRRLGVDVPISVVLNDEDVAQSVDKILNSLLSENILKIPESEYDAVLTYHGMLIAASLSGSYRLVKIIIDATFEHAYTLLHNETDDSLLTIAKRLGLSLEQGELSIPWLVDSSGRIIPKILKFSMNLVDYLKLLEGTEDPLLSLPNSFIKSRRIYLDRARLIRLLSEIIKKRIEYLIDNYKRMNAPMLEQIGKKYARELAKRRAPGFYPEKFPPCIKKIIENAKKEEIDDVSIYVLITFLANINTPQEFLEDLLLETQIATTQSIESLTRAIQEIGTNYTPLKCSTEEMRKICGSCNDLLADYYSAIRSKRRSSPSQRR